MIVIAMQKIDSPPSLALRQAACASFLINLIAKISSTSWPPAFAKATAGRPAVALAKAGGEGGIRTRPQKPHDS